MPSSTALSWNITRVDTCDSTNTRLANSLRAGQAGPGDVLVATKQTAGRGRLGRFWVAPAGALTFSLAVPEPKDAGRVYQLNLVAGLALASTVATLGAKSVAVKWPNDVLINGKKVAGILSETVPEKHAAIIGIGLNLNSRRDDFPADLKPLLTTVRDEISKSSDEENVLKRFLDAFKRDFTAYQLAGLTAILPELRAKLAFRGARVRVTESPQEIYEGALIDIDAEGLLNVKTDDGRIHPIITGDVTPVEAR